MHKLPSDRAGILSKEDFSCSSVLRIGRETSQGSVHYYGSTEASSQIRKQRTSSPEHSYLHQITMAN